MAHIGRRRFFTNCSFFAAGAVSGPLIIRSLLAPAGAGHQKSTGAEERIRQLGIELRKPAKPPAPFEPAVLSGNILYVSGHGPRKPEGGFVKGKVGAGLTMEQGREAARLTGLDMLSTIRGAVGSLDRVVQLLKVTGMVNSTDDFTQHPAVINGFSELMIEVFGEKPGKGARSAVGMSGLPFGIPVEIEAVFEVRN